MSGGAGRRLGHVERAGLAAGGQQGQEQDGGRCGSSGGARERNAGGVHGDFLSGQGRGDGGDILDSKASNYNHANTASK